MKLRKRAQKRVKKSLICFYWCILQSEHKEANKKLSETLEMLIPYKMTGPAEDMGTTEK